MSVTVRYFAGARAAAGAAADEVEATDVTELLDVLTRRHGDRLARVLGASSLLVDGVANTDRSAALEDGCVVEVLPPFAGG